MSGTRSSRPWLEPYWGSLCTPRSGRLRFRPVVILNAYTSQVLVASVAEALVCWAVVGSVSETLQGRRWLMPVVWAAIVASVSFGVYHPEDAEEVV